MQPTHTGLVPTAFGCSSVKLWWGREISLKPKVFCANISEGIICSHDVLLNVCIYCFWR